MQLVKENKRIQFNGNGYSEEWQEAARRGLLNHRTSVDAYAEATKPAVVSAFEKYGVLNERELRARYEVAVEQYNKSINIEANFMVLMANRYILPEAYRHQAELGETVSKVKAAGVTSKEAKTALERLCRLTDDCRQRVDKLQTLLEHQANGDAEKHARFPRQGHPGHERPPRVGRQPGVHRAERSLAAASIARCCSSSDHGRAPRMTCGHSVA